MPGPLTPLPGKFAIKTYNGHRLTAVDGGGRSTDAIHTDSVLGSDIGPFDIFTLWRDPSRYHPDPSDPEKWYHQYAIQTANGNYLTADAGGGSNSPNAIQTDRTQALGWEMFGILNEFTPGVSPFSEIEPGVRAAIVVASGNYLTAVSGGGKNFDPLHTDATEVRQWELFQLVRLDYDLGSALSYFIVPSSFGTPLTAVNGGGETKNAILPLGVGPQQPLSRAVFRLERQPNNTYALRTSNGHYVTADQGGGREATADGDTLQTNRTQPQAWEQFVFFHGGKNDGTFVIQTHEGSCIGRNYNFNYSWATNVPTAKAERFTLVLAGF